MVVIVFRKSLEVEVLALLRASHIDSYTDIAEVLGAGTTGPALHTFARPGYNSLILAALPESDADRLVRALRTFRDAAEARQHGAPVPLHVFVLPCEQVI